MRSGSGSRWRRRCRRWGWGGARATRGLVPRISRPKSRPGCVRAPRRTPPRRSWARPRSGSTSALWRWTAARSSCAIHGAPVFEDEWRKRGLPLLVLPPRSPRLNGIVERANRTVRVECWSQYRDSLACAAMNEALQQQAPAPLPGHEDPGRIRYGGGDGCLTPNVRKVGDPHMAGSRRAADSVRGVLRFASWDAGSFSVWRSWLWCSPRVRPPSIGR